MHDRKDARLLKVFTLDLFVVGKQSSDPFIAADDGFRYIGLIIAGISPSASMVSIDLSGGIISIFNPGGGVNSTSSLRSTTHVIDWCGTP